MPPHGSRHARRLLIVAWAGADWQIIRPLLDAGELPALAGLMAGGACGNLATVNPHLAPLQWTALATGKRADKHGILGYFRPSATGARPVSPADRRARALWNLCGDAGLRVHVAGWPVSHPAEAIHGVMASDLFPLVEGTVAAPLPPPPGALSPAGAIPDWADYRIHPGELGLRDLAFFVEDTARIEPGSDPLLARLARAVARDASLHAVATHLLEGAAWDVMLARYAALDMLGPPFMAMQPPRPAYVPFEQFGHYRHTVQGMYRYLDMQLGRLLDLAGEDATVMLVSQRGYRVGDLRPRTAEEAAQRLAAPWYRDQGILVMKGPGIRANPALEGAGLLDIVPTALALLGLPVGRDMDGRPLRAGLDEAVRPVWIGSWETPGAADQAEAALEPDMARTLAESFRHDDDAPRVREGQWPSMAQAAADWDFNLAMALLDARRPGRAAALLARLAAESPGDARLKIHLARAREALGDEEAAIGLYAEVVGEKPARPREQLTLGALNLARKDYRTALMNLFRAEQAQPNDPLIHCRIGEVYLRMKRWEDARRAFDKALALDPEHALAHHGLAVVHLAARRYPEAVEAALTAVGLRFESPQAHFHLGIALARLDRVAEARRAFANALALNPDQAAAHHWLARLHELADGDPEAANTHRRRAAELDAARILRAGRGR